jgi:hypothetical protein
MTFASPATPWQVVTIGLATGGGWTVDFAGTQSSFFVSPSGDSTASREIEARFESALKRMEEVEARPGPVDAMFGQGTATCEPFDVLCGRILADSPDEIAQWIGDNILPGLTQKALATLSPAQSRPEPAIPDCPACGKRTKPGARFCGGCGAKLS